MTSSNTRQLPIKTLKYYYRLKTLASTFMGFNSEISNSTWNRHKPKRYKLTNLWFPSFIQVSFITFLPDDVMNGKASDRTDEAEGLALDGFHLVRKRPHHRRAVDVQTAGVKLRASPKKFRKAIVNDLTFKLILVRLSCSTRFTTSFATSFPLALPLALPLASSLASPLAFPLALPLASPLASPIDGFDQDFQASDHTSKQCRRLN